MTPEAQRWIEAAKTLAADPTATVICPKSGDGPLTVHDERFGSEDWVERSLTCDLCGARNILRMRRPKG